MDSQDIPLQLPMLLDSGIGTTNKAATLIPCKTDGKAFTVGSISSAGLDIEPYGDMSFSKLIDIYREQAAALADSCDIISIENMPELWNIRAAVFACKKSKKPVIVILKTDEDGETETGTCLLPALISLQELGIVGFGISGGSPETCAELIGQISQYAHIPLVALPDAEYTDEQNTVTLSAEEYAKQCEKILQNGAQIIGGGKGASNEYISALKSLLDGFDFDSVDIEKQDTSLVFATDNQVFFLDPDTTEFSPVIECSPYMDDIITDTCDESYDVLTVAVNSPDDAIDFAKHMHMATLPVAFLSDDDISLKMALMLYQGRAIADTKSLIEPEKLKKIADKYGAVLY